ncbi:MAG: TIGR02679 family protein, partial [Vitreoscilla sp.]|nr:TIGR02679 family protein [Vitreoscilla sp.]
LRRHYERQSDATARTSLHLSQLSAAEREALALLTGRPPRGARSMQLDIARIDAALQDAGVCHSLREALELLDGPITNHTATRAAHRLAWATLLNQASSRDARLHAWLQEPAAGALLKRLSRQDVAAAEALLAQADAVLRCLPSAGITRAQLAAQTLGNAHALDAGQAVANLVLAAWRCAENAAAPPGPEVSDQADEDDTSTAEAASESTLLERARDIWARAGVLVNELARPALVLNLPVAAPAAAVGLPGEPAYLSLRQLLRTPPAWAVSGRPVFICENPNLLAIAADRLGPRCAPLVCTDGMPAAAQRTLLNQLAHAGARLHYHGDFDWPGLQIANHVLRTWRATPWRLSAADYEAAVQTAPHTRRDLTETNVTASWDARIAAAMWHHGLSIAEEAVADVLIDDLRHT